MLAEVALIKMCRPQMETDLSSVLERMRMLEASLEQIKTQGIAAVPQTAAEEPVQKQKEPEKTTEQILEERLPKARAGTQGDHQALEAGEACTAADDQESPFEGNSDCG